jgi:hypothetical protein
MKLSKSTYFSQDREKLAEYRHLLALTLANKGFKPHEVSKFLVAFDAFANFPNLYDFDGATIIGDCYTINGLSATAMKHDYDCIIADKTSLYTYLKDRLKCDKAYRNNLIKSKRKLFINFIFAYSIWIGLIITIPIHYLLTKNN